jgi:hypothetical protein
VILGHRAADAYGSVPGFVFEVVPSLVAFVVATAFARGGYGTLRLPDALRFDRLDGGGA